jgi:hypothetical protein
MANKNDKILDVQSLKIFLKDPTWLDGVGALEIIHESTLLALPANDLPRKVERYSGSVITKLVFIKDRGVLVTASGSVPKAFLEAFADTKSMANIPYSNGHFVKVFSPDYVGAIQGYFMPQGVGQPFTVHSFGDVCQEPIVDIDIVYSDKHQITLVAVSADERGIYGRQAFIMVNADLLLDPKTFVPHWNKAQWTEGHDIADLRGMTDDNGNLYYFFVDNTTRKLMRVPAIDGKRTECLIEHADLLFKTATCANLNSNLTAVVNGRIVQIDYKRDTLEIQQLSDRLYDTQALRTALKSAGRPHGLEGKDGYYVTDVGHKNPPVTIVRRAFPRAQA